MTSDFSDGHMPTTRPGGRITLTLLPDQWAVCWLARTPDKPVRIDIVSIHPRNCAHCERPRDELLGDLYDFWAGHPGWWAA
jgi:hypothetical protein